MRISIGDFSLLRQMAPDMLISSQRTHTTSQAVSVRSHLFSAHTCAVPEIVICKFPHARRNLLSDVPKTLNLD